MTRTLDTSITATGWALGAPRLALDGGALVLGGAEPVAEAVIARRRRGETGGEPAPREQLTEAELRTIEDTYADGITAVQVVEVFVSRGIRFSEATFRKYVQLGLLPRSVRVGRKGKSRGSQGLYPATVVRRFDAIRRLMGQGYTIDQIQREFLFVRGELEELSRTLERLYAGLEKAIEERGTDELVRKKLGEAREVGADLLRRLDDIEQRMSMRARMQRAHV